MKKCCNTITPSWKNLFSLQLCIRLASDWRRMFCSTRDLIIPWTKFAVLKICLHLETISVEFTNNASNFAEEWRFHINNYWNVVSQVKKKISNLKVTTTKGSHLRSQTMHSLKPRRDGLVDVVVQFLLWNNLFLNWDKILWTSTK